MKRHAGFVLEWYPPHVGGVETLFAALTTALASEGWRVTVVTTWIPGTPRREVKDGVSIIRVRTPKFLQRYFFTLLAIPAAVRALRSVDLVHTTTYNAAVPAWVAARLRRKPIVLTVHEVWDEQWHRMPGMNRWVGHAYRLFESLVLRLPFALYQCDSEHTRSRLERAVPRSRGRAVVVYPALDYDFWERPYEARPLREELGLVPDAFVYIYFGRPGVSKGIEYLIDAVPRVRALHPESVLVLLMARDPARNHKALTTRVRRLGLEGAVVVLDPVPRPDLPRILLAADCVVVPSLSEGFGYSALEAVVLGRPVVATTGHSVEEVVGDGAVFVPPADPEALAEAIAGVAGGGRAGGAPTARFDVKQHIDGVLAAYDALLPG